MTRLVSDLRWAALVAAPLIALGVLVLSCRR